MRLKYIFLFIFVLLIIGVCAGFVYLRSEFKASVPQRSGTIQLQTLRAPVTITFDQMGIPQVWAHSTEDLWFAMDWLHAADRLFQMDLTRRVSQGRLAEFFGSQVLEIDRSQRKIGHSLLAQKSVDSLSIRAEKFLDAYVTGINSWVENQGTLPFEYFLLNANWMYADARGNIGYQLGSPIPVRQNSQSVFRVPGWTDENEWQGYQPLERTPHSFNPERGWLASYAAGNY